MPSRVVSAPRALWFPADFDWNALSPHDQQWTAAFEGKAWEVETAIRLLAPIAPIEEGRYLRSDRQIKLRNRVKVVAQPKRY